MEPMESIEPTEIRVGDRVFVPERNDCDDEIILTGQELKELIEDKTKSVFFKNMKFLAVREITQF